MALALRVKVHPRGEAVETVGVEPDAGVAFVGAEQRQQFALAGGMVTNAGGRVERRRRCVIENESARPAVAPYPNSIVPAQVFLSSGFGFRMESSLSKGLEVKGGGFSSGGRCPA